MSLKTRKKLRFFILGACIAAGLYFGAFRMMFIPFLSFIYRHHYGMLTMLHSVEYLLIICAGIVLTASSGLIGVAISWLLGLDGNNAGENGGMNDEESSDIFVHKRSGHRHRVKVA